MSGAALCQGMAQSLRFCVASIACPLKSVSFCSSYKPGHFHFFVYFWFQTGPRDPSRCVGIAEISLGARSKRDLVEFLSKKLTFRSNVGLQALLIRFCALCSLEIASGTLPQDSERVFPSVQGPHNCLLILNHSQIMNSPKTHK